MILVLCFTSDFLLLDFAVAEDFTTCTGFENSFFARIMRSE